MVKPVFRRKSIGTKVSEEEYARLETLARKDPKATGEPPFDRRSPPASGIPMQSLLVVLWRRRRKRNTVLRTIYGQLRKGSTASRLVSDTKEST